LNVAYGVGKAALDRLTADMHAELKKQGIAVVSLYPGIVKTENVMKMIQSGELLEKMKVTADMCETPLLTGRAVASLAADVNILSKSGKIQVTAELAKEYGFTEEDGSQPPSIRSLKFLYPYAIEKTVPAWLRPFLNVESIPDWKLPFWVMRGGKPDA